MNIVAESIHTHLMDGGCGRGGGGGWLQTKILFGKGEVKKFFGTAHCQSVLYEKELKPVQTILGINM